MKHAHACLTTMSFYRLRCFQLGQNATRFVCTPCALFDDERFAVRACGFLHVQLELVELVVLAGGVFDVVVGVTLERSILVRPGHFHAAEHSGDGEAFGVVERGETALEVAEFKWRAGVPIMGRDGGPCRAICESVVC